MSDDGCIRCGRDLRGLCADCRAYDDAEKQADLLGYKIMLSELCAIIHADDGALEQRRTLSVAAHDAKDRLHEQRVALREAVQVVESTACQVWFGLQGSGTGYLTQLRERMAHPQPGDWVVETTTVVAGFSRDEHGKLVPRGMSGVGRLLRVERRRMRGIDAWEEGRDGPIPTEPVTVIECLDGTVVEWTNAHFVALFHELCSVPSLRSERPRAWAKDYVRLMGNTP